MIVEFRVANFRSFWEEQVLSLVASADRTLADNLIPREKFSLLKTAAVCGANASGKSNLIKAFDVMGRFLRSSATSMTVGDAIAGIAPFRLARDAIAQPSAFAITVIVGDTRFEYGFSATRERVWDEWLVAFPPPHGRAQQWLERRFDPSTGQTAWAFRQALRPHHRLLRERTRDNGLVLARGAELNVAPLGELYLWFSHRFWVLDLSDRPRWLLQRTADSIRDNESLRGRAVDLLRHADLGIDDVRLVEHQVTLDDMPTDTQEHLTTRQLRGLAKRPWSFVAVRTLHGAGDDGAREEFDFEEEESNGTQRLFALAGPVLDALDSGAALVVDELECSMHPLLTRKLVELFHSPAANRRGAQLIFATHDSTLMDPRLLRRDQLWLTEKAPDGATRLFSLYDFGPGRRPRNTEALQRRYLAGRYGGVPAFGPTLEDAELG